MFSGREPLRDGVDLVECRLKVVGERRFELHPPAVVRMLKSQAVRVEKRAPEPANRAQVDRQPAPDPAVQRIADDGMADAAQMHTNLMRAAGSNRDMQQGDAL